MCIRCCLGDQDISKSPDGCPLLSVLVAIGSGGVREKRAEEIATKECNGVDALLMSSIHIYIYIYYYKYTYTYI